MSGYNMAMQAMQSMGGRRQAVFFLESATI